LHAAAGLPAKINFAGNLLQSRLRSNSILDEGGTRVQRKELMNPIHGVITAQHNSPPGKPRPGKPRKNPGPLGFAFAGQPRRALLPEALRSMTKLRR